MRRLGGLRRRLGRKLVGVPAGPPPYHRRHALLALAAQWVPSRRPTRRDHSAFGDAAAESEGVGGRTLRAPSGSLESSKRPSARPEAPCCCSLGRHLRQALLAHEARLLRELRQLLRPPEDLPPAPSPQPPAPSGAARGCPGGKGGGLALGVPEPPREAPVLTLAVPPGFRSEVEKVTRFRRRVSEVCIEGRAPAHDGHDLELE
ncbi:unnamed protein product, partial [Prorocentrum cordatum]